MFLSRKWVFSEHVNSMLGSLFIANFLLTMNGPRGGITSKRKNLTRLKFEKRSRTPRCHQTLVGSKVPFFPVEIRTFIKHAPEPIINSVTRASVMISRQSVQPPESKLRRGSCLGNACRHGGSGELSGRRDVRRFTWLQWRHAARKKHKRKRQRRRGGKGGQ